ncbi:TPA: nucleoside triphosphate pyrophosphohydrolase family protein [Bacillus pacificus]
MLEIKEGMLIKYNCLGEIVYGVVDKIENDHVHCYWSDDESKSTPWCFLREILDAWDIVDFRKVPTKPYGQLVSYYNRHRERTIWGVYTKTENGKVYAHWNIGRQYLTGDIYMSADRITNVEDIIIHEEKPKAFTFKDFDASVKRTWKDQDFKDAVSNAALGLTGEAGEVADLIKKAIYHKRGFLEVHTLLPEEEERALSVQDVKDELSDVLYYVSAMAQEFGFTLEDVAKHNKEKLEKRFPEGFSTEASAQKADKHVPVAFAKPYKTEFPNEFPFYARVIGDSPNNPTGCRHFLKIGSIVKVTRNSGCDPVKAFRADDMCVLKSDLEYIGEVQK